MSSSNLSLFPATPEHLTVSGRTENTTVLANAAGQMEEVTEESGRMAAQMDMVWKHDQTALSATTANGKKIALFVIPKGMLKG